MPDVAYQGTAYPVPEALLTYADSDGGRWPLKRERPILEAINTWVALRESDAEALRKVRPSDGKRGQRIDPLADRIAAAWGGFIIGDDPTILPGNEADQENMADLIGDGDLDAESTGGFASELVRAVELCVSEGEVWGRIYADRIVAPRPILEWVSRLNVLPLWQGTRLASAAVVTELPALERDPGGTIYRLFEVHAPGLVVNALYRGTERTLGDRLAPEDVHTDAGIKARLTAHPMTEDVNEVWAHGLPFMLLDRVANRIRKDRRIGTSDYAGILDELLDLNEVASIGAHNMKLSARKRAVISEAMAQRQAGAVGNGYGLNGSGLLVPRAKFGVDEEVFVNDPLDDELGKSSAPFSILEYSFDAEPLIRWKLDTVETALTRIGLSPQYVGVSTGESDGYAVSGTSLRLRLIPTDSTGDAKARYWDDAMPRNLRRMAMLSALPEEQGGFGVEWADPIARPIFRRTDGIPVDTVEQATTHASLTTAGLLSVETSLRERYPDADEGWYAKEIERIREDRQAAPAGVGF
jgi:hypothetical protein